MANKRESFQTIRDRAETMVSSYAKRNTEFDKYERIFKLAPTKGSTTSADAEGNPAAPRARKLFDPHGHNVIKAVARMYVTNPPTITLAEPRRAEPELTQPVAAQLRAGQADEDSVERFLRALLYRSDVVSDRSLIADALFSAALFGPITQVIDCALADLPEGAKPADYNVEAPFVFWCVHPKNSYPRLSRRRGLFQHVYTEALTVAEVRDAYGDKATAFITGADDTEVTLYDYIDDSRHVVWLDEYRNQAILDVANDYHFIPRTYRRGEGVGFLTDDAEYESMPMLFAYLKSGLWAARNVAFTAAATNLMDYLDPHWVEYLSPGRESRALPLDFSVRGGQTILQVGEKIEPLAKQLIPGDYFNYLALLTQQVEESTISRISGTGATAFAALNLLAQVSISATYLVQKTVADSLAQTLSKTLRWAKRRDQPISVWGEEREHMLRPTQINSFEVRVSLKPDREVQKQFVANMATGLFRGLGLGYDQTLEMLEEGNVIASAQEALDGIIERAVMEAELPKIAKESAEIGRQLWGFAARIPETPETPPGAGAGPGLGQGVENPADLMARLAAQANLSAAAGAPTPGVNTQPMQGGQGGPATGPFPAA